MQVIITHYIALDYYNIICLLQASALLYQKVDIKLLEEDVKLNMFWIVYIGIGNTRTHVYTFEPNILFIDSGPCTTLKGNDTLVARFKSKGYFRKEVTAP